MKMLYNERFQIWIPKKTGTFANIPSRILKDSFGLQCDP